MSVTRQLMDTIDFHIRKRNTMEVNGVHQLFGFLTFFKMFSYVFSRRKNYRFETTWGWVNDDRIFILKWTIPLIQWLLDTFGCSVLREVWSRLNTYSLDGQALNLHQQLSSNWFIHWGLTTIGQSSGSSMASTAALLMESRVMSAQDKTWDILFVCFLTALRAAGLVTCFLSCTALVPFYQGSIEWWGLLEEPSKAFTCIPFGFWSF